MTLNIFLEIIKWLGTAIVIIVGLSGSILVAIFFLASALYIIPSKQRKIDLKEIASTKVEQRIYLDEYQYTLASEEHRKKIEEKAKTIKDLDSKIRKRAAELKSITAKIDAIPESKTKPKKEASNTKKTATKKA